MTPCYDERCQKPEGHVGPHGCDVGKGEYAEWTDEITELLNA